MATRRTIPPEAANLGYEGLFVDTRFSVPMDPRAPVIMEAWTTLRPEALEPLVFHSWVPVTVKSAPYEGHPVELTIYKARFTRRSRTLWARDRAVARKADKTIAFVPEQLVYAPLPDISERFRMTRRLERHIQISGVTKSPREISRAVGVSETIVRQIVTPIRRAFTSLYRPTAPIWLGIDELHYRHEKRTILSDAETSRVIDVLPNAKRETVIEAIRNLAGVGNIRAVACDLYASYISALRTVLPLVPVVADRWHILKLLEASYTDARRVVFAQTATSLVQRTLRAQAGLLDQPYEKLDEAQRALRSLLLKAEPSLAAADRLRKDFRHLYEIPNRASAERYFSEWKKRIPLELAKSYGSFVNTVERHYAEIFAYWDHRTYSLSGNTTTLTTSSAENINRALNPILEQGMVRHDILRQQAILRLGPLSAAEVVDVATAGPGHHHHTGAMQAFTAPQGSLFGLSELPEATFPPGSASRVRPVTQRSLSDQMSLLSMLRGDGHVR